MPKIALDKVAKKIRKKKGALDGLGDRNAARMNRASLRDQKLKHAAKVRNVQKEHGSMGELVQPTTGIWRRLILHFSSAARRLLQGRNEGCDGATQH